MFWSEIIPSFLFVILLFLIPESPRYLVSAKKDAEARHILSRLLPKGVVKNTLDEIREVCNGNITPIQ
jgi:hypothetical protein